MGKIELQRAGLLLWAPLLRRSMRCWFPHCNATFGFDG
jgi:hypothetical protein